VLPAPALPRPGAGRGGLVRGGGGWYDRRKADGPAVSGPGRLPPGDPEAPRETPGGPWEDR